MTESETAVRIAEHGKEIGSLKHRVGDVETEVKIITQLAMSVERLAMSVETLAKEQTRHGEKIANLEAAPGDRWNTMTRTVLTSLISTLSGGLVGALIAFVVK